MMSSHVVESNASSELPSTSLTSLEMSVGNSVELIGNSGGRSSSSTGNNACPQRAPRGRQRRYQTHHQQLQQRYAALPVYGDFDVIAQFEDLSTVVDDSCAANINLRAIVPVEDGTIGCFVNRALIQGRNKKPQQMHQANCQDATSERRGMRWLAKAGNACRSGRLRLARRGSTVTFLIAESDSDRFRVIHSEDVGDQPLAMQQLRLHVGSYSQGTNGGSVDV